MTEDMFVIGAFFSTVITLALGVPLVRAYIRRMDQKPRLNPGETERDERLARMEMAIESMAVEIERISEGQRFVTKLLAERESPLPLPARSAERGA
jgi:hypothetical protein